MKNKNEIKSQLDNDFFENLFNKENDFELDKTKESFNEIQAMYNKAIEYYTSISDNRSNSFKMRLLIFTQSNSQFSKPKPAPQSEPQPTPKPEIQLQAQSEPEKQPEKELKSITIEAESKITNKNQINKHSNFFPCQSQIIKVPLKEQNFSKEQVENSICIELSKQKSTFISKLKKTRSYSFNKPSKTNPYSNQKKQKTKENTIPYLKLSKSSEKFDDEINKIIKNKKNIGNKQAKILQGIKNSIVNFINQYNKLFCKEKLGDFTHEMENLVECEFIKYVEVSMDYKNEINKAKKDLLDNLHRGNREVIEKYGVDGNDGLKLVIDNLKDEVETELYNIKDNFDNTISEYQDNLVKSKEHVKSVSFQSNEKEFKLKVLKLIQKMVYS